MAEVSRRPVGGCDSHMWRADIEGYQCTECGKRIETSDLFRTEPAPAPRLVTKNFTERTDGSRDVMRREYPYRTQALCFYCGVVCRCP